MRDIFDRTPFPRYINNLVQWDSEIHPLAKTSFFVAFFFLSVLLSPLCLLPLLFVPFPPFFSFLSFLLFFSFLFLFLFSFFSPLTSATFAGAGRYARIEQQKTRLTGLRFKGEEECCHSSYDITLHMLERNCLLYLGPEKFPTRRHELLQKKPSKEISFAQSQLVVKDKQSDLTCPTVTELEVSNALKRRALAFDLAGLCTHDVMAAYHADLLDHLHTLPPPGYSAVSVQQVLRADRAAFMFLSAILFLELTKPRSIIVAQGSCYS